MILKTLVIILSITLIIVGLAGTVLPLLPGNFLIFGGILLFDFIFGFQKISIGILILLFIIALLSFVFDFLAASIGAKKFGASRAGIFGAILGGVVGFFIGNIFGIILGPLIGAFLGEIISGENMKKAGKASFGTLVGFLGGTVMRLSFGLIMVLIFVFALIF